jgi:uncharacterized membrane protein YgdD (TMEM256/DUF423 family)
MSNYKLFLLAGTFFGAVGVILGAFGAHALRKSLSPELLSAYQTGVLYQLIHALALIAVALAARDLAGPLLNAAGVFLLIGIVFFSGSLYILALTSFKFIGILTPVGGVAFIAGWAMFFMAAWKWQVPF